jgi:hypothetical protein
MNGEPGALKGASPARWEERRNLLRFGRTKAGHSQCKALCSYSTEKGAGKNNSTK